MDDAVRPSKETFNRILDNSYNQWHSYLEDSGTTPTLPSYCLDLKSIIGRMPSFLGYGLLSKEAKVSFAYVERESGKGKSALLASGQSVWAVSGGFCSLEPNFMPLDILLAVPEPLVVQISDSAPLASWLGIQGVLGYDEGNYITVLFLAWAYVLSARWAESLAHSSEHRCTRKYKNRCSLEPNPQNKIELGLGNDVEAGEASWWNGLLYPGGGWEITTEYNQKTYQSPWSTQLSNEVLISLAKYPPVEGLEPPSSSTVLAYLTRLCSRHRLYGQLQLLLLLRSIFPFSKAGRLRFLFQNQFYELQYQCLPRIH